MTEEQVKFLKVFAASLGIITTACEKFGISNKTFYNWKDANEDFKEAVEKYGEEAIDFAESKLFELINGVEVQTTDAEGETKIYTDRPCKTSIIFYLKTKGKKRGYVERTEIDQNVNNKLTIELEIVAPITDENPS